MTVIVFNKVHYSCLLLVSTMIIMVIVAEAVSGEFVVGLLLMKASIYNVLSDRV